MSLKFVHTADAHVDASTHAHSPSLRAQAWAENVAALRSVADGAITHGAEFIIHAGDSTAHGRPSPEALMMFTEALREPLRAGIPLILLEGNHERLRHRRGQRTATAVLGEMLSDYGEVHVVEQGARLVRTGSGHLIGCLPWLDSYAMLAEADKLKDEPSDQYDFVAHEAVNLLAGLVDEAKGEPLVLASHIAASGSRRGSEMDMTALFREPVVNGSDLAELGASYVALGHIHTPQTLAPGVWFSGSPQRFTFTDEPDMKSYNLVELADDGSLESVTRMPTTARPMQTIDLEHPMPEVRPDALVRLRLREGEKDIPAGVLDKVSDAGGRVVVVDRRRVKESGSPVNDNDEAAETLDAPSALRMWLADHHPEADADAVVQLAAELEEL